MSSDEFDSPEDESSGPFDEGDGKPAVFVTTREPVQLSVAQVDDPRAPDSSAFVAHIDGRMVARSAMPPEAIERLIALRLFEEPVRLGLFAFEDAPGLQCRLFALVPSEAIEAQAHADEPWKASVPRYEARHDIEDDLDDAGDTDEDEDEGDEESIEAEVAPFETILLGHIVRFDRDRRHPEDLAAEAVDVLQRIIHGADSLQDADRKAIEDLLGSL
jgi:hypothetical protein